MSLQAATASAPCNSALGLGRRAFESRAVLTPGSAGCAAATTPALCRHAESDDVKMCRHYAPAPGFCGKRVTPFCLALLTAAWAREKSAFSSGSLARIFSAARRDIMGRRGGRCVSFAATAQAPATSTAHLQRLFAAQRRRVLTSHRPVAHLGAPAHTARQPPAHAARQPPSSAPADPGCGVLMGWSATQHRMMSQITFQGASVFTPRGLACVPDTLRHGSARGVRVHALAARPPAKAPPQPTPFRHGPDALPAVLIPATSSLLHKLQQGIQQTHEHAHR